jgi:hypothetical protein
MFGNYQPQHEDIVLPLDCGAQRHPVRLVFLHKAVHVTGRSIEPASGHFYYLAVRKLMKSVLHLESVQMAKLRYEQGAPVYAQLLMNGVSAQTFDAVAAIPTSDPTVQDPYKHAFKQRWTDAPDLSPYLSRSASSTDEVPCEERLDGTTFRPPPALPSTGRILLIDDVLQSGVSAASALRAIERVWTDVSLQFTLCCPLWIVHQ